MRRDVKIIEKPSLAVHIDYDHITVGELGNILIRLQAALRSIAGLSPGEYDETLFRWVQPRFIISAVHTKRSIDIHLLVAILLGAPGAIYGYSRLASDVFHWFKVTILNMSREQEGLKIEVTKGKIDLEASRPFLDELTPKQQRAIGNFLWSLTGPARRVNISDDESEISMEWKDESKDNKV